MKRIEITHVGDWPDPVRSDGVKGSHFEAFDTGEPHPDPEWSRYTRLVLHYRGEPVRYLYEGDVHDLAGYSQQQVVALRDQLLEHFAFDPQRRLFSN